MDTQSQTPINFRVIPLEDIKLLIYHKDQIQRSDLAMTRSGLGSGESKLKTTISYILIIGVIISVFRNCRNNPILSNVRQRADFPKPNFLHQRQNFFAFIIDQFGHLFGAQSAVVFMTLGLIILILTPYIRAITSVIYFAWEKNRKYVLITLFVLIVLTVSLALH